MRRSRPVVVRQLEPSLSSRLNAPTEASANSLPCTTSNRVRDWRICANMLSSDLPNKNFAAIRVPIACISGAPPASNSSAYSAETELCRLAHLRIVPDGTFWHDSSVSPTIGPFDMSQLTPTHGAGTARPILGPRSGAPHPSPEGPATTAFAAPSYLERHGTPQTRPISRSAIASVFGWPPREVCTHGSLNETVRSWRSERRASSYSTMPNRLSPLHWLTAVLLSRSRAMFIGTSRICGH